TPLINAVSCGLVHVCEILLSRVTEIDMMFLDSRGNTAEQIAEDLEVDTDVAADDSNGLSAANVAKIRSLFVHSKKATAEYRTIMSNILLDASVPKVLILLICQYTFPPSSLTLSPRCRPPVRVCNSDDDVN